MRNKILSLLVLLLTAATGAWAADTYTVAGNNAAMFGSTWDATYTANDMTKNGDGTYSITYTNVYLTENVQYKVVKNHSWDEAYPGVNRVINIAEAGTYTLTIHFNPTTHEVYETMPGSGSGEEVTITLTSGQTVKTYENVTLPWSTTAEILKEVVTDLNFNVNINAISGGDGKVVKYGNENFTVTGTFSGDATVTVTYNMGSSATITVTAPRPLLTLNEAKTEATMESMPTNDVTIDYELVRDMSISMTTTMGDGTDGVRYRVKKAQQGDGYEPADLNMMQVLALVAVNDGIEQKALTLNQDYYCRIYKLDEQTLQPIGDGVMLFDFDFAPGLYALKAFAQNGGDYAGETALSNTFKLFQGYEVEVAAKEFITYYKDEPLYADTETSADAVIYTISSVNDTQAVLSSAIETAPSLTPLLIFNNSDEAKTFLLIPADAEPNLSLDVYDGFIGTLTATTIAASDEDQTNYAFNGKAFVYVKYAIPVAANKAWLNISNSNARVINIVFDETTGITNADRTKSTDDSWYTIDGRKVNAPTKKGVYILNGQKVVVK